jgi:hypothetical protein
MDFKVIVASAQQLLSKHTLFSQIPHTVPQSEEDILLQFSKANVIAADQHAFLAQILHGCVRNHKLISKTLELFYKQTGTRILLSKYNLYACMFHG